MISTLFALRCALSSAAVALAGAYGAAGAAPASPAHPPAPFRVDEAVADAHLDTLRGGFDDRQGLRASFGFERITMINGQVVAHQAFRMDDVSRITEAQALALRSVLGGLVVQNGPGNGVGRPAADVAFGATVIQNSLSDQTIRTQTTIDAATNSLGLLRAGNLATTLRDALTVPVLPRP